MGLARSKQRTGSRGSAEGFDNTPAPPSRPADTARIDPEFEPGYLALHRSGELKERGETLWSVMDGWWTDAGQFDSLRRATNLVAETGANND